MSTLSAATSNRQTRARPQRFWLWLPLTPIAILLAPLVLAIALIVTPITWLVARRNALVLSWRIGGVILALGGTRIYVNAPDTRLNVWIF